MEYKYCTTIQKIKWNKCGLEALNKRNKMQIQDEQIPEGRWHQSVYFLFFFFLKWKED